MIKSVDMTHTATILIIDDDQRNIFALTAVLRSRGFTVQSASSAREGLHLLEQNQGIKVVLMDIMMPEMDGYEAIIAIRRNERFKGIKLIAVTAQAMVGDREKCLAAGADAYISKPVDIDRLMEILL